MRNTSCFQFMNALNPKEANLVKEEAGILPVFSCVILAHDIEDLTMFLESYVSWQRCWWITGCAKQDRSS